jgi:hypothetical protein
MMLSFSVKGLTPPASPWANWQNALTVKEQ